MKSKTCFIRLSSCLPFHVSCLGAQNSTDIQRQFASYSYWVLDHVVLLLHTRGQCKQVEEGDGETPVVDHTALINAVLNTLVQVHSRGMSMLGLEVSIKTNNDTATPVTFLNKTAYKSSSGL